MSWSLVSVSYRMSGSGSWQNLLPDEPARRLYAELYPEAEIPEDLSNRHELLLSAWRRAAIIKSEGQKILSLGPIMTDEDLEILGPWFEAVSDTMCAAVWERLPDYRLLASRFAGGKSASKEEIENVLTIQVCAHTLDSWVFALLRRELIGTYPPRDFAGSFFFWGYAFAKGPERIFGFTTYGGRSGGSLHVIRSHGLDRERLKAVLRRRDTFDFLEHFASDRLTNGVGLTGQDYSGPGFENTVNLLREVKILKPDDPPRLAVPVFTYPDMKLAAELYEAVSAKIIKTFSAGPDELKVLISQSTFARCSRPDILCMLFHLAYSYAADKLVKKGVFPDFPREAGGEWGVWIH